MECYLLLELLVDSVQRVLDSDSFVITSTHFQAQWEVQVNLLDRRIDEVQFENVCVFDGVRGGIESPEGRVNGYDINGQFASD